ncbi:hypothetical protein BIW11_01449 [Tropilaelaps mercedesae]|uniref:Uncharacterized protein n=1 Tax=Tropilaelaps mercedesae TaxID=418985 RepID=A0A1V9XDQ0_9ACAR|nr:hypothetical protein BIW11_01449 [Tropilaelaps mercedesae]
MCPVKAQEMEPDSVAAIQMTSTPKPEGDVLMDFGAEEKQCEQPDASDIPIVAARIFDAESAGFPDQSIDNSAIVKDRQTFKSNFNLLNKRFASYVEKVRCKETKWKEAEEARKNAEEHLEQFRIESNQQLAMLRNEAEWHVRQAVQAKEIIEQLRKDIESSKNEYNILQQELGERREREASLEMFLVSERNKVKALVDERNKFQDQRAKYEQDRKDLCSQLTKLKVENATLQERGRIAMFERTIIQSKMAEVDKKLQFSSEDVSKKVEAERDRLQKLGLEKLEDVRQKHDADIERLKREFNKKLQDTLLTYVSCEDFASLETRFQEATKRAEDAEGLLAERQELLKKVKADLEKIKADKNKEIAAERRRCERINTRLIAQKQSYESIRQELETYRQLIESLDLDREALANTPFGAKRPKVAGDTASKVLLDEAYLKLNNTPPSGTLKARQMLLRRALTPKRMTRKEPTSSAGSSKENESNIAQEMEPGSMAAIQMTNAPTPEGGVSMNFGAEEKQCEQHDVSDIPMAAACIFEAENAGFSNQSIDDSAILKDNQAFQSNFNSLNKRFASYVEKVQHNKIKLKEAEAIRKNAEEHLEQFRIKSNQQLVMLQNETEWHVRQAVQVKEIIKQLRKDIESSKNEYDILQQELGKRREREASLEMLLVSERNKVKALFDERNKFQDQHAKYEQDRKDLYSQLTKLKVENATLQEREKVATFKRTILLSRMTDMDKKLRFSSEDVSKKFKVERDSLQKLGLEKLKDFRQKHDADIERLKREFNRKLQDILPTYVSCEDFARLETRFQEAVKRTEDAKGLLTERQELPRK